MKVCPNCGKKVNEKFVYCRNCGSRMDGEIVGDFTTDIPNLFKNDDGYYYLFTANGIQQVIVGDDVDEVKRKVLLRKFPWPCENSDTENLKRVDSKMREKSEFLKISSQHSNVVNASKKQSHASFDNTPRPKNEEVQPYSKKTPTISKPDTGYLNEIHDAPPKVKLLPDEDLPRSYGVVGLYRDEYGGRQQWVFKNNETPVPIHNDRLEMLKREVLTQECSWEVVSEKLEGEAYELDREIRARKDEEILAKKTNQNVSLNDKIQLKKEMESKKSSAYINMDKIRW